MAYSYLPVDRDQLFLLPASMREWLPEDHLAWFVIDVVDRVDTSAFDALHPNDGAGRPAYDPKMLLALLLYAYAEGMFSSRRIERLCRSDVAYRVICANHSPDHTAIARFRADHGKAEDPIVSGINQRLHKTNGLTDGSRAQNRGRGQFYDSNCYTTPCRFGFG